MSDRRSTRRRDVHATQARKRTHAERMAAARGVPRTSVGDRGFRITPKDRERIAKARP